MADHRQPPARHRPDGSQEPVEAIGIGIDVRDLGRHGKRRKQRQRLRHPVIDDEESGAFSRSDQ